MLAFLFVYFLGTVHDPEVLESINPPGLWPRAFQILENNDIMNDIMLMIITNQTKGLEGPTRQQLNVSRFLGGVHARSFRTVRIV